MDKAQKQEQLDFLRGLFADVESIVLSSVEGLNAAEVTQLRRKMHQSGVEFRVIKNTIAQLATQGSPVAPLSQDFTGSTAMAWSKTDAVLPAKILVDFAKDVEKVKIKAGYNAGRRLDLASIKALADLPSLGELRAQLLGLMQTMPAKLLGQINAPASHVVGVISAKVEKEKETV